MHILIAPDSFKESLTGLQAAQAIQRGFATVFPHAQYTLMPLADGGEGTDEVLQATLQGRKELFSVFDPLGRTITASLVHVPHEQLALITLASASGLHHLKLDERNPLLASTYGTGQLLVHALDLGVKRIYMGLGGSATNDSGVGIAHGLGVQFFNQEGEVVTPRAGELDQIAHLDCTALHPRCSEVELIIACDVNNPLCGANGASAIFGPQKGATPAMVTHLDQQLEHFAQVVNQQLLSWGCNPIDFAQPGYGAAGGASVGMSLCFPLIKLVPGISMVLDALQAERVLATVDLVITGEGKMDNQTLTGKVRFGIGQLAQQRGIPVIAINGALGKECDELSQMFVATYASVRAAGSLESVLAEAEANLEAVARNVAQTLQLGSQLATRFNQ